MILCNPPRGAAGRLMRLEGTQMLLDDFGIPLQINSSSDSKEKPDAIHVCHNTSISQSLVKNTFALNGFTSIRAYELPKGWQSPSGCSYSPA